MSLLHITVSVPLGTNHYFGPPRFYPQLRDGLSSWPSKFCDVCLSLSLSIKKIFRYPTGIFTLPHGVSKFRLDHQVCNSNWYNQINLSNKEMINNIISYYNKRNTHFPPIPIMTFVGAGDLGESKFNIN